MKKPTKRRQRPKQAASEAAALDRAFVWHPFTQMREWTSRSSDVTVITSGRGAVLRDDAGREYLDGNSSIWTNLHGHRHPTIDRALRTQLAKLAHSSFLGLTNDVAPRLAERLVRLMRAPGRKYRVFFSDDGSTAIEAALKMAVQARVQRGEPERVRFVSLASGYHGDTVGAMSVGQSGQFHRPFKPIMFPTREVASPACYRCPFNKARPQRGCDQRESRRCNWECVGELRRALDDSSQTIAALVMEPRVQGPAGMWMHPPGYLKAAARLCRERGIWLLLDEVMTGFGRTGTMFACQKENVRPDLIALGKGITGGYLPLAATLASGEIFDAFNGEHNEFKTFFHGHSYSGNPLGCAAALASLDVFAKEKVLAAISLKAGVLKKLSHRFWDHPNVGDVRQEGLICAVELVADFETPASFPSDQRISHRVCAAARKYGLLTRPIGDVLVLMPPYCTTARQLERMVAALWRAVNEVLPLKP